MLGNSAGLIAYAAKRGVTILPEQATVPLVKATDYIDAFIWAGEIADVDQEDSWPRIGIDYGNVPLLTADGQPTDVGGNPVPRAIIYAVYRLAIEQISGVEIMPTQPGGKQILEERIEGAITIKYAEGTLYDVAYFPWFNAMVGQWLGNGSSRIQFKIRRG